MMKLDRIARGLLHSIKIQLDDHECYEDVEIDVEGQLFKGHRFILAAHSDFFQALFSSGMKDSTSKIVTVEGILKETFKIIYDFIYSGHIEMRGENINAVWHAANQLQMQLLLRECRFFQIKNLRKENCVEVFTHAKLLDCEHLTNLAWDMILKEFDFLRQHDDNLLELEFDIIMQLIRSDLLNVSSEDNVLDFIWAWCLKDKEERIKSLDKLLMDTRLTLATSSAISNSVLKYVEETGSSLKDKVDTFFKEAMYNQSHPDRHHDYLSSSSLTRSSGASSYSNIIVCITDAICEQDGQTDELISESESLSDTSISQDMDPTDFKKRKESRYISKLSIRTSSGHWYGLEFWDKDFYRGDLVSYGNVIYGQSWTSGHSPVRHCFVTGQSSYLPYQNELKEKWKYSRLMKITTKIKEKRLKQKYNLTAQGDFLYSIGGPSNTNIERYNAKRDILEPHTEVWEKVGDLTQPVTVHSVLPVKNTILVFGKKVDKPSETVVQQFDLHSLQCTQLLEDALSPFCSSVCFRFKDSHFLLQSDGSLLKIICTDINDIKVQFVTSLWGEDLELTLYGATCYFGYNLKILAEIKGEGFDDLHSITYDDKSSVFSHVDIFNRAGSSMVNAVMPQKHLHCFDDGDFAE